MLLDALAQYDIFQYENQIKPDYSNAGGLQIWDTGNEPDELGLYWSDWYDETTGYDIDEYMEVTS